VLGTVGGHSVIFMVKISVPVVSWVRGGLHLSPGSTEFSILWQQLHDCMCALRDRSTSKDGETQVGRDLTQHFFTPAQLLVTVISGTKSGTCASIPFDSQSV
jgi:hypothetical protein